MVLVSTVPLWAAFLVHLVTFFLAATACHAELARRRPSAHRLTEFYLTVALGGALGGLFNALIAPAVFTWVAEYPLGLALAALLAPAAGARALPGGSRGRAGRLLDVNAATAARVGRLPGSLASGSGASRACSCSSRWPPACCSSCDRSGSRWAWRSSRW